MEIKTLEQYAIAKINDLENENAKLKLELEDSQAKVDELQEVFAKVKDNLKTDYLAGCKTAYVAMKSVYESSDPEKYDWYLKTFGLKEPEKENNDEQE